MHVEYSEGPACSGKLAPRLVGLCSKRTAAGGVWFFIWPLEDLCLLSKHVHRSSIHFMVGLGLLLDEFPGFSSMETTRLTRKQSLSTFPAIEHQPKESVSARGALVLCQQGPHLAGRHEPRCLDQASAIASTRPSFSCTIHTRVTCSCWCCCAGVTTTKWAIEYEQPAAEAFKLNHPDAEVFCENCNVVLR